MSDERGLAAKIRNLFSTGKFNKRYEDGKIQVATNCNRTLEKKENFPYGFFAKAPSGKALVFCMGGNFDGFEIMPVCADDDVELPELEEGDSALYAAGGGWVISRADGSVEINHKDNGGWVVCKKDGTVELNGKDNKGVVKAEELKTQLQKLTARVDGIIDALKNSPTAAQDGGASYKAAIVIALNLLANKEDFSNIASDKVLHGNG